MRSCRFLIGLLLAGRLLAAPDLIPIEKFAAGAQFSQAKLSPDGNFIASIKEIDGFRWLTLLDLATRKSTKYSSGTVETGEHREIAWFRWVSNTRIAYLTTVWDGSIITGMSALDRDGSQWTPFAGRDADPHDPFPLVTENIIYAFGDDSQSVLVLGHGSNEGKDLLYPDVVKVSTLGGTPRKVVANPGNVAYWVVDHAGAVRLGITFDGLHYGAIYRDDDPGGWRTLPTFRKERGSISPFGFDSTGRRLIVVANNEHNRRAVYFYDIAQGKIGDLIAGHDSFDIIPEMGNSSIDGVPLDGPIVSQKDGTVLGINYIGAGPNTLWFDANFASVQAGIDKILPHTFNLIVSHSDDAKRYVVLSVSDRDPGTYYLLDLRSGKPLFYQLAKRAPDLPVPQLAPMLPIQYTARDGLEIHGFLTLPLGKKGGLPLVVMPHGGPNLRDIWLYSAWVQFLANRGYAVLQMNYRGSPGYGTEFFDKGRHEIGRGIQTDIDDGTRWAIAQGFADPKRIAIFGASYGGYSALFALAHSPELYRCGISFAGVTDWRELVDQRRGEEYKFAYLHFRDWVGDPETNAPFLASISPVSFADKIKAPLLIVQGEDDRIVPPDQARRMVAALEATGHRPRTLYFPNEGHGLSRERDSARFLGEMEGFLAENLSGPDR